MATSEGFRGLRLYNTLTRTKGDFVPLDPANVRFYVCGPTVYDHAHIGNARPVIVFDVLFRLLRHLYGADHVRYVRNITDVDDKINARAAEEGVSIREVTDRTLAQFHADIDALGTLRPTVEPRATDHIDGMRRMIDRLIVTGHAYVAEHHVLFHVASMADYGKFSGWPLDEMQAGARVDVAPYKRDPMDFVLWKPSRPGEPAWPSPGDIEREGRPGWHIECSAMAEEHLGEVFDIHGGGIDLVFPHHENEVAQSRSAHGTPVMANFWMHNGFLQVEGQKMSKSLGNFVTISDVLADWPGEVIRFNMLRSHYRQPIDWTVKGLEESGKVLDRWYTIAGPSHSWTGANPLLDRMLDVLSDDLNTPQAITYLHSVADEVADDREGDDKGMFRSALNLLGLMNASDAEWRAARSPARAVNEAQVRVLVAERIEARRAKNWAEADRIRARLDGMGVVVMDNPGGTEWELKR